jgi:hypothetical protein
MRHYQPVSVGLAHPGLAFEHREGTVLLLRGGGGPGRIAGVKLLRPSSADSLDQTEDEEPASGQVSQAVLP